jgi:PKD repeat protein
VWSARIRAATALLAIMVLVPGSGAKSILGDREPVRVEPASLVIDQNCSQPTAVAPLTSRLVSSDSPDPARLTISSPLHAETSSGDDSSIRLRLDQGSWNALRDHAQVTLHDFVLPAGRSVRLDLHRLQTFDDQTVFVAGTAQGDRPVPPPDAVLMAGSVQGIPRSAAFLALSPTGNSGYIVLGDTTYVLSSGSPLRSSAEGSTCVISSVSSLERPGGTSWSCGFDAQPQNDRNPISAVGARVSDDPAGLKVCNVAIDCDYQFFLMMGGNESVALNYVAVLVAAVSSIYERDLHVALRLSYARVWTTEDPYQTCGYNGLAEFQAQFKPAGLRPHLAFKFSGCGGAAAALGTLSCPTEAASLMPVAAGRVVGHFPYPMESSNDNLDPYVVAHEIGHIFGSPHTHCYDPPLDRCYRGEGLCYDSTVVCSRGSIMSYCNQCGGMSNIDFDLPPRVVEKMAPVIAGACMEPAAGWLYVHNDDSTILHVDSITNSAPWMRISRSAFMVAPYDSQRIDVVSDWDQFLTLQQTGQLGMFFGGIQSPIMIPVTANRVKPFAAFSATPLAGCAPLSVRFADQSAGLSAAWFWNFGDDSSSRLQNPIHVYMEPGRYTMKMAVSNSCGTNSASDSAVIVVTGPACRFESPVIVNRDDSLIRRYDLWRSIGGMTAAPDSQKFSITAISRDSCGVRVDDNRYLSISPVRGWTGNSMVRIKTADSRGCSCEGKISVIINEPPTIQIDSPDETFITNRLFVISWSDADPDDDAMIMLYQSKNPDCSSEIPITGKPLSEDEDGHGGSFYWYVTGVPDGRYYIQAVITDEVSSSESCGRGSVIVDHTPPVTSITMSCEVLDSNGWCRSDGLVSLSATDNLTGVSRTSYRVNRSGWTRYTRPFRVNAQGSTIIEYFSTDAAGNAEPIHVATQPFNIDSKTPFISKLTQDNDHFVDGDYMSSTPSFSFQILDDGSGIDVATLDVTIEPGTVAGPVVIGLGSPDLAFDTVSYAVNVSLSAPLVPGRQMMTVRVADYVGNIATANSAFQVGGVLQLEDVVVFPNPTHGPAEFTFKLTQDANVSIQIYDLSGNLVRKMMQIACKAGYNALPWNGWSDGYGVLASGAYIYEVVAKNEGGSVRSIEKMAVLR